jgi:hypothetical protein
MQILNRQVGFISRASVQADNPSHMGALVEFVAKRKIVFGQSVAYAAL